MTEGDEGTTKQPDDPTLEFDREIDWLRGLTGALAVAVVVTLLVGAATSAAAFDAFNPSWDGASDFRDQLEDDPALESDVLRETSAYDDLPAAETTAFVIAPDERYGPSAADDVARFVEDGGTLVVLDNFGTASNDLLESVGSEVRFDGRLVRDDRHHEQGPEMPVTTATTDHELTVSVDEVTLNRGSVLSVGDDSDSSTAVPESSSATEPGEVTVLLRTSEYAQLEDRAASATDPEPVDASTTHAVATVEDVGEGRVVVVSDPSITINAMVDRSDNAAFLHALAGDDGRVVFDRSHGDDLPPLSNAILTLQQSPPAQAAVGVGAIVVVGLTTSRRVRRVAAGFWQRSGRLVDALAGVTSGSHSSSIDRTDRPGLSPAEQARYLRERHPEWDDDRIGYEIGKFNRREDEFIRNE